MLRRALRAHQSGDLAKAERLYNAVLQHNPENFDALHGLGQLHYQHGRFDTALVLIQTALKRDRGRAEGFASLGLVFHFLRRFNEALVSYDEGLSLDPDNVELLNRRGVALLELRRPFEALQDFERVLAVDPDHFEALGNYGNALIKLNRPEQAIAAYDRALAVAPDNAQLLTNRAVALRRLDRPHEALMSASRALLGKPDFAQARFVESVARLTLGDFAAGWRGYEARWAVGLLASQRRAFTAPLWLGQETPECRSMAKPFCCTPSRGLATPSSSRAMCRWSPRAAPGKSFLKCSGELVPLLAGMAGVDAVIARGEPLPAFDLHCPLLSLPLAFATTLDDNPGDSSLHRAARGTASRSGAIACRSARPRIGLAWSGERGHDNDLNRSIALATLAPLFDLPDIAFISLQHDVRECDVPVLQQLPRRFRPSPTDLPISPTPPPQCRFWMRSLRSIPPSRISPARWACRSFCCCRWPRIFAGCASGQTVRGIRRPGFTGNRSLATGTALSRRCGRI